MDQHVHQHARPRACSIRGFLAQLLACAALAAPALTPAQTLLRDGFEGPPLGPAPTLVVERDDRVATLSMDYNAESPWVNSGP